VSDVTAWNDYNTDNEVTLHLYCHIKCIKKPLRNDIPMKCSHCFTNISITVNNDTFLVA